MDVRIPLIENQVIDHTGTYRIVQRTVNGQTGLVIEEYIPEPEPEEEVLQNNSNTRAMIIDEEENNNENNEENNNNGQMVLRGQNNVRGLPDSNGTAIEGTFNININTGVDATVYKIRIGDDGNYIADSNLNNNWTFSKTDHSVSITSGTEVLIIRKRETYYDISFAYNYGKNFNSIFVNSNSWYYLNEVSNGYNAYFYDNNNKFLFGLLEDHFISTDNIFMNTLIGTDIINFNGISWMTFN